MSRVVTKHYLRRRARAKAHELNIAQWRSGGEVVPVYKVVRAERGPSRWYVVRI